MSRREDWISLDVSPVLNSDAMTRAPEDLSLSEAADAWQLLDLLRERVEARLKTLRDILMSAAERDGKPTEKGGFSVEFQGATIERQKRTSGEPDLNGMLTLLGSRKIHVTEVYDEIKSLVFNPSKADHLIRLGKLSQEEIEAFRKVNYALRVDKADEWKRLFERAGSAVRKKIFPSRATR